MKAVVLAAGRGQRLASLNLEVPKPMIPIAGRPLLEYTVALLQRHGVKDVFINLHEKAQTIPAYFAGGEDHGVRIHYLIESELSGTAGPLRNWTDHLREGTFLLVYGDVLTDIDLAGLLEAHRASSAAATIAVHQVTEPERCGVVTLGEDFRVTNFVEKPTEMPSRGPAIPANGNGHKSEVPAYLRTELPWANAGVYALEPEVLDYIPDNGECDFGRDVFPSLLNDGRAIYAYRLDTYLMDVGAPERYLQAEQDLLSGKVQSYVAG